MRVMRDWQVCLCLHRVVLCIWDTGGSSSQLLMRVPYWDVWITLMMQLSIGDIDTNTASALSPAVLYCTVLLYMLLLCMLSHLIDYVTTQVVPPLFPHA